MSLAQLIAAFARRLARDPVGGARLVWARLLRDPLWVLMKLDGSLPAGTRRTLFTPALRVVSGARSVLRRSVALLILEVFLAHSLGDHDRVASGLDAEGARRRRRGRLALARFASEIGEPDRALHLLEGLAPSRRLGEARGRALWRGGWLGDAEVALAALPARGSTHLLDRVRDERAALRVGWRPSLSAAVIDGVPGRILHAVNNSLPQLQAGYTVRTQEIGRAQRALGLDPTFVTKPGFPWTAGFFDAPDAEVVDGVPYRRLASGRPRYHATASFIEHAAEALAAVAAELRPALLHPTTPFDNGVAALAVGAAAGLPVVYEVRGFLEETWLTRRGPGGEGSERHLGWRAREADVAGSANAVVTLSYAMAEDLVARGVDRSMITVVPNGVDAAVFTPVGAGSAVRRRLGIDPDVVTVGYVSSLSAYEGVRHLLDAVAHLLDRGERVHALVVGDGPDRPSLERHAAAVGLRSEVTFTGRVPGSEVAAHYEAIDLFVVPRIDAAVCRSVTPLKPVEAMAMERPLIVSALPALEELVDEGTTGLTFRPEDGAALAEVIQPLVRDPAARRRLGQAARAWVLDDRTWHRNAQRYRSLYDDLGAV